ncbi:cAMP-dependent protein kinase inhibitor gamma isoform X1 [Ochotona princeps]|uniref:cAMP-dependent protein kinase inhibitor gamma isoform X1 n=1 Tax=Ochotona princeps TaxID=9978 RepID=UPI0027153F4F|nr:cAMP-dependent protein kinase inhibitor gamma isoform X1 [Ochotona princeps]
MVLDSYSHFRRPRGRGRRCEVFVRSPPSRRSAGARELGRRGRQGNVLRARLRVSAAPGRRCRPAGPARRGGERQNFHTD